MNSGQRKTEAGAIAAGGGSPVHPHPVAAAMTVKIVIAVEMAGKDRLVESTSHVPYAI